MITPDYCRLFARYGEWMNERLYACCAELAPSALIVDRHAFFGSILGTLNHLLWGDRVWLARFTGASYTVPAYGVDMYADLSELRTERQTTDSALADWANRVTQDWLASTLEYRSAGDGKTRSLPASIAAMHLFNHGTHHRGQLTTLLKQADVDPGVTDLPWTPGVAAIVTRD